MAKYRLNVNTGEMAEISEAKFLVNAISEGSEWSKIMTGDEIFRMMDMEDCYDISIDVWKIKGYGEAPVACSFLGKWFNSKDPQRMEIRSEHGVEAVGYGVEH